MSNIWDYMKKAKRPPVPTRIERSSEGLAVTWDDGVKTTIAPKALRGGCQCAHCVDEMTRVRTLDVSKIPADIAVAAVNPVGNYAVQLVFSDGHETGIYDWRLLRGIGEDPSFG